LKYVSINQYVEYMKKYHLSWERFHKKRNEPYNSNECKNIDIFKKWCEKYNIVEYCEDSYESWMKLDSKKRYSHKIKDTPLQDHAALFRTLNKEMIFITQPYANMKKINDNDVLGFCNERGLDFIVSEELSWHYPKETLLIQYSIKDKVVFDSYIKQSSDRGHLHRSMVCNSL
jgi:hypothetical protein